MNSVQAARLALLWVWLAFVGVLVVSVVLTDSFAEYMIVLIPNALLVVSGSIIFRRTDQRTIGWILIYLGVVFAYAIGIGELLDDKGLLGRVLDGLAAGSVGLLAYLVLIFPGGEPPNRLARFMKWPILGYFLATTALSIVQAISDPATPMEELWGASELAFLIFFPLAGLVLLSQIMAYRHRDSVQRSQIKWFLLAGLAHLVIYPILFGFWSDNDAVFFTVDAVLTSLWPLAILIAITRYRLFDIDRFISRTLGYAIVIGTLAAVFVALTSLPGLLIGGAGDNGAADAPPLLVAASTLAVAALFNPVRKRVIGWVDRRFNRSSYDAERVVAGFGERLQDEVDLDRLTNDSLDIVADTMQPETIGIWVRE